MRIENEIKLDFKDVLIRPKRSTLKSRQQVDVTREYVFKHSGVKWKGVPIIAANMDTVGTFEMAKALAQHKVLTAIHKHYSVEEWRAFAKGNPSTLPFVAVSGGTSEEDFKKLGAIIEACPGVKLICLDVANGYSEHFVAFVKRVRGAFPKHTIMAGNVVTGEMVEELVLSGADIVKVGIGPGSVCTTRKKAGVGYPQLSATIECADAAHGLGGLIVADGGCTNPGDIAKAFGGGADFVMLGGMFAAHEESAGATVEINGKLYKEFYGMSSATAMKKHAGGVAEYRASEGKHVHIQCKGPVSATVLDILGGIRSACTYVGASHLKSLSKCTTFIRVSQQTNETWAGQPGEEFKPGVVAPARSESQSVADGKNVASTPTKSKKTKSKSGSQSSSSSSSSSLSSSSSSSNGLSSSSSSSITDNNGSSGDDDTPSDDSGVVAGAAPGEEVASLRKRGGAKLKAAKSKSKAKGSSTSNKKKKKDEESKEVKVDNHNDNDNGDDDSTANNNDDNDNDNTTTSSNSSSSASNSKKGGSDGKSTKRARTTRGAKSTSSDNDNEETTTTSSTTKKDNKKRARR